ncbi:unnamed protein product [Brassica rapa subsp. narinosa]
MFGSPANARRLRSSGCDSSELSTPTTACLCYFFRFRITYPLILAFTSYSLLHSLACERPHHHPTIKSDPRDIESVKKKFYLAWKPSSEVDFALEEWMVDQMHIVRPAVETVFENLLLQLLLAKKIPSIGKFHLAEGLNVDGVLESWGKIKPVTWKLGMKKLEMIGLKRT